MIRHIVFFSANRHENIEAMRAGLMALGTIPHSSLFEVTLNSKVDPLSDEIDVVVYAEFSDEAALTATICARGLSIGQLARYMPSAPP